MASGNDALQPRSLRMALNPLTSALVASTFFSLGINLLMLVSPLYLMQVFDRVLTSSNLDTLFWLTMIAVGCVGIYGALEVVRARILSKIGIWLECRVTERLIRAGLARAKNGDTRSVQPLRDLAQVRGFLSGPAIQALFDAPWAIVFLAVLWSMHPWFGVFGLCAILVQFAIATATEFATRTLARATAEAQGTALQGIDNALRNSDAVHAMGMVETILARWTKSQTASSNTQNMLNDRAALLSGLSKFVRMSVQLGILGIGAVLTVKTEITGGGMIAASILLGRALAPVDVAIGAWKQIVSIRSAWRRVNEALSSAPMENDVVRLPTPQGHLSVEGVSLRVGQHTEPLLKNICFEIQPGRSIAIVGPSAAGKSLLCRVLVGITAPTVGHVRLDHADLDTWHPADLRPHVGYLPQEVSLFPGTVGENIARLGDADPRKIIEAAQLADVHELILRLPQGYQTNVGEFGHLLSGGQRQRIGLARAVFGTPKLVVLDEPNSNLDPAGEAALVRAIHELRERRCTLIVVSHKLNVVHALDETVLLQDGAVRAHGPSDEVLSILMGETRVAAVAGKR